MPDTFEWLFFEKDKQTIKSRQKGEKVQISYSDTGFYDVMLIAGNKIGCVDTLRKVDAIEIIIPDLKFEADNPIICQGENILLKGLTEPIRANFRHFWELYPFADSTDISTIESESVAYKAPKAGIYHLKYAHQILDGCRDSAVRNNLLMVNGLDVELLLDTNNGCTPLLIKPVPKINYNYHFGNTSDSLQYSWSANPNNGVLISDKASGLPEFTFTQKGKYTITLSIKNSSGCELERTSEEIYAGVKAGIGLAANEICTGAEMLLSDASSLKPDSVWWVVSSEKKFERRTLNSNLHLRPLERGQFHVSQIVSKGNLCFDTAWQTIKSIEVKSKFSLSDTLLYCAPAYAQFEAIAIDADTFIWNFGDGESLKTTDVQIANIYKRNSGWANAYTITLISKSALGCSDTVVIKDALQIIGPVPKFSMSNFSGCEPLTVRFVDLSEDAFFSYMNYNDGSPLDSNGIDSHEYIREIADDIQIFNPSFYAIDQLGCAAVYEPNDSVRVIRSPKAELSSNDSFFCLPDSAVFIDATPLPHQREWWLNNKTMDTGMRYSQLFPDPGNFNITLFVKNQYGCSDTLNAPVFTKNPPKAALIFDPEPCFSGNWEITGVNKGNSKIKEWQWFYNAVHQKGTDSSLQVEINGKGPQTISAEARDEFGCTVQITGQANVFDADSIPLGKLSHVSFGMNEKVNVFWTDVDPLHLDSTHLIIEGLNKTYHCWKINSINSVVDDYSSPSSARCYRLAHVDQCGVMGKSDKTHCPIILEVQSSQAFTIQLNWTNYVGWDFVEAFDIYRKVDRGMYEYLNTVDGTTFSYLDTGLCNKPYSYYVIGKLDDLKTRSNQNGTIPKYDFLLDVLHMQSASVENDQSVRLLWPKNNAPSHREYRIFASELGNPNYWTESITRDTSWIHELADVHNKAYSYQIQALDHCDIAGPAGRLATSIFLRSSYVNNQILLEWNPYEEWEMGVEKYQIELLKDQSFALIKEVDGSNSSWVDTDLHLDHSGPLIYRVRAIENGNESVQSLSNTSKVIGPSVLWIPNAFSPNNDKLNETFKPVLRFAQELSEGINAYSFSIYNRWGEKIFETNRLSEGWNGYYLGNPAQGGTYMFNIHFMGADGILYDKEGTVLLIR
jgi:gliding motility-associated-like protein